MAMGTPLRESCHPVNAVVDADHWNFLKNTVPVPHVSAAHNIKRVPIGAACRSIRSGPIKIANPDMPRAKEINFSLVRGSPRIILAKTAAQTGMVKAMIAARPAGIWETP